MAAVRFRPNEGTTRVAAITNHGAHDRACWRTLTCLCWSRDVGRGWCTAPAASRSRQAGRPINCKACPSPCPPMHAALIQCASTVCVCLGFYAIYANKVRHVCPGVRRLTGAVGVRARKPALQRAPQAAPSPPHLPTSATCCPPSLPSTRPPTHPPLRLLTHPSAPFRTSMASRTSAACTAKLVWWRSRWRWPLPPWGPSASAAWG